MATPAVVTESPVAPVAAAAPKKTTPAKRKPAKKAAPATKAKKAASEAADYRAGQGHSQPLQSGIVLLRPSAGSDNTAP